MSRSSPVPVVEGALVVDKPAGRTSHDVVEAVRRLVGFRRIGHLGTLDPIATGVLVLLLGRATRLAQFYSARRKRYLCTFRFGFATDTYDAAGEPLGADTAPGLAPELLAPVVASLLGRIEQIPPPFSAKKIHGRPAHELARKKKPVELKPVEVDVYELRLLSIEGSSARFSIECGPGTYVRSLAQEMGRKLGCGAHVSEITRTAVGEFTLDQAMKLEEVAAAQAAGSLAGRIIPMEALLSELPSVTVLPIVERRIRHGARFTVPVAQLKPGRPPAGQDALAELDSDRWKPACVRVFSGDQRLIAIAQAVVPRVYQPMVVMEAADPAV
ncbi:MAG TPA: tRNA pseudouridine(55) synthase TruB [Candidatus Acidoferrales bacterium]|nr:tRNA pseudouridine(55) synthase TruB [Candidatus Acidoferrales bacterium]